MFVSPSLAEADDVLQVGLQLRKLEQVVAEAGGLLPVLLGVEARIRNVMRRRATPQCHPFPSRRWRARSSRPRTLV